MGKNARSFRRPRVLGVIAAVVLLSQFVPAASRAGTGSIFGSVEDVDGSAIRDICIAVSDAITGIQAQRTVTDANGMYAAHNLASGDYKVYFSDCVPPFDFAPEWNGGVRDESAADPVTVTLEADTEVNAALDRWGDVHGSVEDVGGSAIRDICVHATDATGHGAGWARTDQNGRYTLKIKSLLGTGAFIVRFYDCVGPRDFAREWNDGVRSEELATPVIVSLGHGTQVDAAMDRWGTITGTVEDTGGSALRDICVRVHEGGRRSRIAWAHTDANGRYAVKLRSVRPRNVKVRFTDCVPPLDFAPIWNGDHGLESHAPWIHVAIGDVHQVNAALDRWGGISGIVTDEATSAPLADVCVRVFRRVRILGKWHPVGVGWARTGGDGTYQMAVRKLWLGTYKVRFSDCTRHRGYITEFFDNEPGPWNPTWVRVYPARITSGIDAALTRGGGGGGIPPPSSPPASISSFSPVLGPVGTAVTLIGAGFTGATAVRFNELTSYFTVDSDTQITAEVPTGASAGVISVSTAQGTTKSVAMFAVSHARGVSLSIGRSMFASGSVSVTDGFGGCESGVTIAIQRFASGVWHPVRKGVTGADGAYRIRLRHPVGRFRAMLRRVTLGSGDVCGAATSRARPGG